MKILIWAPFINKVGTTTNVINSISAIKKYSENNKYIIDLVDVFGEWDKYKFNTNEVNKIKLLNNKFIFKSKKTGYLRSRFFYLLIFLFSIIPLFKLLKKNNYDFLIIHLITSLPIFLMNFLNIKTKLILCIAGFPKLNLLRKSFWKFSKKNIYKVVCPSEETKDLLLKKSIFNDNKMYVIYDPHINIKRIQEKKNDPSGNLFETSKEYIVAIGRLTKQKNYIFLLKAFEQILKIKKNLNLLIIGEGEDRKEIEKTLIDLNIKNNVFLLGYQKNIYSYLKKSKCYLSASIWEGPDLAMLDSAFLNVPIICSDCKSGRKEFIGKNKRGYIFKTNDLKSLLDQFNNFLNEKPENVKEKLIEAKKEVRNFSLFRYYLKITKLLT